MTDLNDKDVALKAVTTYGEALQFASDELKNDKVLVLEALERLNMTEEDDDVPF